MHIVNEELDLDIRFSITTVFDFIQLADALEQTSDRFGQNHLASQGQGVQAALVIAMAQAWIRCSVEQDLDYGVTFLLEEPENGLHVDLQRKVMASLEQTCHQHPDLVVIITTNSPFMIPSSPTNRVFEIEERDGATLRKDRTVDGPLPSQWLDTALSATQALWDLVGTRSIARVLDLYRKAANPNIEHILFVEGHLDKKYIETALAVCDRNMPTWRIITSGESLEIRDQRSNFESAGAFMMPLQLFLSFGWSEPGVELHVLTDGDPEGTKTLFAMKSLTEGVLNKIKELPPKIKFATTSTAMPKWAAQFPKIGELHEGSTWIETEFEDLWPLSYLDKYFTTCSDDMKKSRQIWQLRTRDEIGTNRIIPKWERRNADIDECEALDLHAYCLQAAAKGSGAGTFPAFIESCPPSPSEGSEFLDRLECMLKTNIKGSFPIYTV
jgi:hypothetical protein